jgi:hypothetical protein
VLVIASMEFVVKYFSEIVMKSGPGGFPVGSLDPVMSLAYGRGADWYRDFRGPNPCVRRCDFCQAREELRRRTD